MKLGLQEDFRLGIMDSLKLKIEVFLARHDKKLHCELIGEDIIPEDTLVCHHDIESLFHLLIYCFRLSFLLDFLLDFLLVLHLFILTSSGRFLLGLLITLCLFEGFAGNVLDFSPILLCKAHCLIRECKLNLGI